MSRKKKLKSIEVRTVPNGYVLTFDGAKQPDGYLYFTPEKLVEGVMMHIGLKMTEQLNPAQMSEFLDTATQWHDIQKAIKEIKRLQNAISAINHKFSGTANRLIQERRHYNKMRDDLTLIKQTAEHPEGEVLMDLIKVVLMRNPQRQDLTYRGLGVDLDKYEPSDSEEDSDDDVPNI